MPTTPSTQIAPAAAPRAVPSIRFAPKGFSIDHPDADTGERLMTEALGAPDRSAMNGLLTQLVKVSLNRGKPDKADLGMMLAMVNSIAPRDAVEAMLVAQMVSVHVVAMRYAQRLANADDVLLQDSTGRALDRLLRSFQAQLDALKRCRTKDEPAITVQTLSVQEGGRAIVGHLSQHTHARPAPDGAPAVRPSPASAPPAGIIMRDAAYAGQTDLL